MQLLVSAPLDIPHENRCTYRVRNTLIIKTALGAMKDPGDPIFRSFPLFKFTLAQCFDRQPLPRPASESVTPFTGSKSAEPVIAKRPGRRSEPLATFSGSAGPGTR